MASRWRQLTNSLGLLILRLGIGGLLLTHGWGKLQLALGGEFNNFADPIGLGSGLSLALIVAAEFFCSLLVVFGLLTRLAALPVVCAMAVAALVVHANDPWLMEEAARLFADGKSQTWTSKELALLYLIPFLALVFTGAGSFSIDGLIGWRRRRQQA